MIGNMFNAIVAASVIAAAAGAQEAQQPTRPQGAEQKPTRDQPGERIHARRLAEKQAAVTTTTDTTNGTTATEPGRHLHQNARQDDGDRPNPEAMVFRFLAEHPEFLERLIARADTNGDGRLSPDERAGLRAHLREHAAEHREARQERRDDLREEHQEHVGDRQDRHEGRAENRQDTREGRAENRQDGREERVEQRGRPAPTPAQRAGARTRGQ